MAVIIFSFKEEVPVEQRQGVLDEIKHWEHVESVDEVVSMGHVCRICASSCRHVMKIVKQLSASPLIEDSEVPEEWPVI